MELRRLASMLAIASAAACSSPVDRLCNQDDGVWTLQQLAVANCVAEVDRNALFTGDYIEQNCRATLQPMFDAGDVSIASDAVLETCRSTLRGTLCKPELRKDWVAATAICNDILLGGRTTGESCSDSEECAGDAYCMRSGGCGLCLAQLASGAGCNGNDDCQSGVCAQNMCRSTNLAALGSCVVDAECGPGLVCRDRGHCEALADAPGQPCTIDNDCGAYQGSCVNLTCAPLATATQACTAWSTGAGTIGHCEWFAGFGCLNGKCATLPTAAVGQMCGRDVATCGDGLWCPQGACVTIVGEGEFCNVNTDCGPYALCANHACTFSDFNQACLPSS